MKAMIVAYDQGRVIGSKGELPWQGKMRRDAHYFRDMTSGHPVIMGRKTYESMGRLLPNRLNIIVTRDDISVEGAVVVHTLEDAFEHAKKEDEIIFVIGGAQIYAAALDFVDTIYATEIKAETKGDAFFPAIDMSKWRETNRDEYMRDEQNIYNYAFVTYERI